MQAPTTMARLVVASLLRRHGPGHVFGCNHARRAASSQAIEQFVQELCKPEPPTRVDNLLAQYGFCTRREVRSFCKGNDVHCMQPDGSQTRVMTGHDKVDPRSLRVNGVALEYSGQPLHIALHKPVGYTVTLAMQEGASAYDLLPDVCLTRKPEAHAVGRLDKGASGLLIFTQSGALNERLTSPRRGVEKEYLVALDRGLGEGKVQGRGVGGGMGVLGGQNVRHGVQAVIEAFQSGTLVLADGEVAAPAVLLPHPTHPNVARVILTQGRFHQLRRMFACCGLAVTGIHRVRVGGLKLVHRGDAGTAQPVSNEGEGPSNDVTSLQPPPPSPSSSPGTVHVALREGEWTFLSKHHLLAVLGSAGDS